jgi:hypothetical protein
MRIKDFILSLIAKIIRIFKPSYKLVEQIDMRTELAQYQCAFRVCLKCWYFDHIPGVVPKAYAFTRGHDCPRCGKAKLRIDVGVMPAMASHIVTMIISKALTLTSVWFKHEFRAIQKDLEASGALSNG